MHRIVPWSAASFVVGASAIAALSNSAEFVFHHPQSPAGIKFVSREGRVVATLDPNSSSVSQREDFPLPVGWLAPERRSTSRTSATHDAGEGSPHTSKAAATGPRIAIEQTLFNFGEMNARETRSHTFIVRNVGAAPLRLQQGDTTCHCTLSELSRESIPPGSEGEITLHWKTHDHATLFSQGATIHTNDPGRPRLELRVEGTVRVMLATWPDGGLAMDDLVPGEPAAIDSLIYSEEWDAIDVRDVELVGLDGFQCEVLPVEPRDADRPAATAAKMLRLTVPPMEAGSKPLAGVVRVAVLPPGADEPWRVEFPVRAAVSSPCTIFGEAIADGNLIDLGVVRRGEVGRTTLTLKVRDADPAVRVERVVANPSFLKATVEPHPTAAPELGLHRLVLEVPPDAPPGSYSVASPGSVRIEFSHPRVRKIDLKVRLAVVE